ncbi:glycosyltransferase family 4 protein [Psychrilyobacter atlanticus]|uniref:glycosyltransferase family 4 protein n=1 Tax=Psychrilyobacter atlanticus TaxID=271091 RepID=UPI00042434B4|nr:glycosyltransferase family 4 protein [Psychrilyobacter atlanticus]
MNKKKGTGGKKKIGMVVNEAWNMYNFRGGLIKKLILEGYEVVVIAPTDKFDEKLKSLGAKVVDVQINSKGTNPMEDLKLIFSLRKIYKREKLDIVFNYTIKPIIYGTIAAKLAKVIPIAVTTGLGYAFIKEGKVTKVVEKLYRFSLRFAKEVWFLNENDKKVFLERKLVDSDKTFVLNGEGIDTDYFKPLKETGSDRKIKFLMIARALWDKGVKEYCEAAQIIKSKHRDKEIEFLFLGKVGVPNPSAVPKEYIEKYHNEGIINYLGVVDDVSEIIEESSCFVLPSYREGISRVIMENASMGKPIIATDVPGCRELVDDGKTGYLCTPGESKDLAQKLEWFINLPEERREKAGRLGRQKMIDEFSEKMVVEVYSDKLKKWLN